MWVFMPEAFDAYQYFAHVRRRWHWIALACVVAVVLAIALTKSRPKQYTATTSIMIESPASMDARGATALTAIYLESLHTYEHFATSDSLFQKALDRFDLRKSAPARSIESWKNQVLKVELPKSTKILEIQVTLPDPKKAHELAGFVAAETIKLNQSFNVEGDQQLSKAAEGELVKARQEREAARTALMQLTRNKPVDAAEAELSSAKSRRFAVERDLLDAETMLAESKSPANETRARADYLRVERKRLEEEIPRIAGEVASRTAQVEQARSRVKTAEAACDSLEARRREARGAAGSRGERLRVIDPGVIPERPSSPNLVLNVFAALLMTLIASVLYTAFEFGLQRRSTGPAAKPLRVAGWRGDD